MLSDPLLVKGHNVTGNSANDVSLHQVVHSLPGSVNEYRHTLDHSSGRPSEVTVVRVRQLGRSGNVARFSISRSLRSYEDNDDDIDGNEEYLITTTINVSVNASSATVAKVPLALAAIAGSCLVGNDLELDRLIQGEF